MKNQIIEVIKNSSQNLIKVRLDYKTFITLTHFSSLKEWLKIYPEAKVMTILSPVAKRVGFTLGAK